MDDATDSEPDTPHPLSRQIAARRRRKGTCYECCEKRPGDGRVTFAGPRMSPNDGRCDVDCPVELPDGNDVGDEDVAPPVVGRSDGGAMRPPAPPVARAASSWRLSRNLARNVAALSGPATEGGRDVSCVVAVAAVFSSIEEEDAAATGTGSRKKRGLTATGPPVLVVAGAAVADEAAPAVDVGVVERNRTPNFCAAATP